MKISVLAVYNTLAEKTSIWCKMFLKREKVKNYVFFFKNQKIVIFKIEKK